MPGSVRCTDFRFFPRCQRRCTFQLPYIHHKKRRHSSLTIIISIQPLGRFGQEPEPSQATGMTLVRCILGKFLGVVCHCFPLFTTLIIIIIIIIIIMGIQPLGRFGRNQSPVRQPVWLWYTASWASS
jgi:hypothetical protein